MDLSSEFKFEISVVIPVYRAEKTLKELHERLVNVFETEKLSFEIIFIEDCGGDQSWKLIDELSQKDERVHGIQLARNYGQHTALVCGIRMAKGKYIVTMDDDLENPPEAIPQLFSYLTDGCGLVYGPPENPDRNGEFRLTLTTAYQYFSRIILGLPNMKYWAPFRVFRNRSELFGDIQGQISNLDIYLENEFSVVTFIKIKYAKRKYGKSGYTFSKLIRHAILTSISATARPIRLATYLGLSTMVFGAFLLFWLIGGYFWRENTQSGFTFLGTSIVIFSGVQMTILGVIGEYIADIQQKVTYPKNYSVSKKTINI